MESNVAALPIYPLLETPRKSADQEWIRLIVSSRNSQADKQADQLFRELAEAIGASETLKNYYILTRLRTDEIDHPDPARVPEIINGQVYSGIERIKAFVDHYKSIAKVPDIE